jgi:acyl carrier protein
MKFIEKKIIDIFVGTFPEMFSGASDSEKTNNIMTMLDSIQMLEMMATIENEFGIFFDESDLNIEHFKNLQTLSEFVSSKYSQKVNA